MKRRVLLTAAIWAGVLGLAFPAGVWIRDRQAALEREEGERILTGVAEMAQKARLAGTSDDPNTAAALLENASGELGRAPFLRSRALYAGMMVDLASLESLGLSADSSKIAGIRYFLDEAWSAEGLPPKVRARIARDQGALCVLEGDLKAAETWYRRSAEADPEDNPSARRLEMIARMRTGEGERGPRTGGQ